MAESEKRKQTKHKELTKSCLVSAVSTSLTHLSLFTIPHFFPLSSLPTLLSLSVVVLLGLAGVGRCCKSLLRLRASPPAFVFFNILFVWGVYIGVVRRVTTPILDFVLNIELLLLITGLWRMLSTDPGYVTNESSHINELVENAILEEDGSEIVNGFNVEERVRYCTHCKAYVQGFDHHCPAFGNCIGQKNHFLFMMLLIGFVCFEASYVACSLHYSTEVQVLGKYRDVSSLSKNLAISTMLFALLQVLWQGIFLTWHIYCLCFNIKSEEWINWRRYPEFHLTVHAEPGGIECESKIRFRNPYDKGILHNLREFFSGKK